MLMTLRCGCLGFLVFAGLMTWLIGWKTVLVAVGIMILFGLLAGIYVKNRLQRQFRQLLDRLAPTGPSADRHDLWVCPACGNSTAAARTKCDSCGAPAP